MFKKALINTNNPPNSCLLLLPHDAITIKTCTESERDVVEVIVGREVVGHVGKDHSVLKY